MAESVKARKPLPPEPEPDPEPAPPSTARAKTPAAIIAPRAGAPASPRPPADRGGEKRVRRGKLEIDASLDLHGHTLLTGERAVMRFVQTAHALGHRTLIIVTGMGRGGEGVLKRALPEWLAARDVRALIAGYAQAHRSHGGAGAFYIFIKRTGEEDA